ncbi:MAG TPA: fibronectin type III domain-containing protein [Saprospiraceae bacterium]|nr:fibronectin type III domain-containing protein [Saprospiraceae bacterium]HPI08255.1 fibronectin type III domain-containing protein [Saprospiraceae bacterium]
MNKHAFQIFRLLFFIFFTQNFASAQSACPLPPPQQLQVTSVTPSSIFLTWSDVPGAVLYRVSIFDQTDQVSLPNAYTASESIELEELATNTHEYLIGVSATACATGNSYGNEVTLSYKPGIIIITDKILQLGCSDLSDPRDAGVGTYQYYMPINTSNSEVINTVRLKISLSDEVYVDFLIWSDCYQQTRFNQLAAEGVKRKNNGNIIKYRVSDTGAPIFDIINGECGLNACSFSVKYYAPCMVSEGTCALMVLPNSCGDKPETPPGNLRSFPQEQASEQTGRSFLKANPNPFSDFVQVDYHLESACQAGIELLNSTGTHVEQLMPLQWTESGPHVTSCFIRPSLPAGIYFLVLRTANERRVMPLLKE